MRINISIIINNKSSKIMTMTAFGGVAGVRLAGWHQHNGIGENGGVARMRQHRNIVGRQSSCFMAA